jgi:predicted DNA-binding protein (MmcQ/YjbR family)
MNIEIYRDYCLLKPGVTEGFPFDENTLVFKVQNKMFALTDIEKFVFINLKCDPERAIELREENPGITPGYHMNKALWNSVSTDGSVSDPLMLELIDHSYELIVASLPKKLKEELSNM